MMQKEVVVVGGGIVGLFCAYYLRQEGHRVIVLDKGDMNSGASYVNAGYLTPSHIVPLAAPGMVTKGLNGCSILLVRFTFNPGSTST